MEKYKLYLNNPDYEFVSYGKEKFSNGGLVSIPESSGTHEENPMGGVPIGPEALVEGGETKKGDYIFSDRLKIPGKKLTFAQRSKQIHKMYLDKRPNDPISKQAQERELSTLEDMQEIIRGEIMSNAYTKAYGGFLKKKYPDGGKLKKGELALKKESIYDVDRVDTTGISNNPFLPMVNPDYIYNNNTEMNNANKNPSLKTMDQQNQVLLYRKYLEQNNLPLTHKKLKKKYFDGGDLIEDLPNYTPSTPNLSNADLGLEDPNYFNDLTIASLNADKASGKLDASSDSAKLANNFGMDNLDYASVAAQSLSGLSQLYYGLKGPDEVRDAKLKLARPSKINLTRAKRLASQEIDNSFSGVDYDIAQTASSAGNYAANRLASGIKRARMKAENNAKLSESEETQNVGIQNQANQFNAQVLNQEEQLNLAQEDKRIQERDAARMAVTEGLNNTSRSFAQGVADKKKYKWQDLIAKNWMGTKDLISIDGVPHYKKPDGSYVPIT